MSHYTSEAANVKLVMCNGLMDSRSLKAPPMNLPTVLQIPPTEMRKAALGAVIPWV